MDNEIKKELPNDEYTRRYVVEILAVEKMYQSKDIDIEKELEKIIVRIYKDGLRKWQGN